MSLISPAALLFDEVARIGSIRKAAEHLNVSPSALNRRILNLEAEFGVPLFERLPRGMRLTAAGEVLIADIRRWRSDQERSKARLQDLQGLRRGHVALGLMECLAGDFARTLFNRIQSDFRPITLDIVIGGTAQILEKIQAGQMDAAVCFNVADRPNLNRLLSVEVGSGIVVSAGHPLAGQESVHLSECLNYPFILPDTSLAIRRTIDRALQAASFYAVPSLVTNSTSLMKRLVSDDRHIAFLGALDVLEELQNGSLSLVPVAGRHLPLETLSLITRNSQSPSTAAQAIHAVLKELILALPCTEVRA